LPQSRSGRGGEKNSPAPTVNRTPVIQPVNRALRLSYPDPYKCTIEMLTVRSAAVLCYMLTASSRFSLLSRTHFDIILHCSLTDMPIPSDGDSVKRMLQERPSPIPLPASHQLAVVHTNSNSHLRVSRTPYDEFVVLSNIQRLRKPTENDRRFVFCTWDSITA